MITRQQPNTTVPPPQIKGIYVALISQAGTAAPTVVVIKNTLPTEGMPVWTRQAVGVYWLTSPITGYFPVGLVTATIQKNAVNAVDYTIAHATTERITIVTDTGAIGTDAILAFTPIEIIIWDRLEN